MKRVGFMLLEVIIGLFFIGIIASVMLPLLSFSFNNVRRIRDRDEMNYIGEMVIEKLKAGTSSMEDVISDLEDIGEAKYEDDDFDTSKYECSIFRIKNSERFLEFRVHVKYKDKVNSHYVEYKASIQK